jgi:hypothetical protein
VAEDPDEDFLSDVLSIAGRHAEKTQDAKHARLMAREKGVERPRVSRERGAHESVVIDVGLFRRGQACPRPNSGGASLA